MAAAISEFVEALGLSGVTDLNPTHVMVLIVFALLLEAISDMIYALVKGVSR